MPFNITSNWAGGGSDGSASNIIEIPYDYQTNGSNAVLAMFTPETNATVGFAANASTVTDLICKIQLYWRNSGGTVLGTHDVSGPPPFLTSNGYLYYLCTIGAFVRKIDITTGTSHIGVRFQITHSSWGFTINVYPRVTPCSLTILGVRR